MQRPSPGRGRAAALALTVAAVLAVTLFRTSGPVSGGWCLLCGQHGAADAIRNVVLFIPVGITSLLATGRPLLAAAAAPALSLLVESAQIAIPGRDASVGDLVFNTVGGLVGLGLVRTARAWLFPRPPAARRLALLAAVVPWLAATATGLIVDADLPVTTYWGQWTPDLAHFEVYDGRVLNAGIGGRDVPPLRLEDSRTVRRLLLSGAPVEARAIAGHAPRRLAPIFSIYDEERWEIMVLGADRQTLTFRLGSRAVRLRLNLPALRYRGALAGLLPGDTIELRVSRDSEGDGRCFQVATTGRREDPPRRRCGIGYSVASGWQLVAPSGVGGQWPELWDILWLTLLYLPLGYWMARDVQGAAGVALSILGLLAVPAVTPLVAAPLRSLAGAGIGLAAGAGLRRQLDGRPLSSG